MRLALVSLPVVLALALTAGCGGDSDATESSAASLEGPLWVLAAGIDIDGWEAVAPTATFQDGAVAGSSGCNRYNAPYTVDGDTLELGAVASTKMACPPPADAVEQAYLAALETVTGWRIDGEELVLVDGDGAELLRYVPGASSEG